MKPGLTWVSKKSSFIFFTIGSDQMFVQLTVIHGSSTLSTHFAEGKTLVIAAIKKPRLAISAYLVGVKDFCIGKIIFG